MVMTAESGGSLRQFHDRPLLVFWEMTKACPLACHHCRANSQPLPGADDLTTEEAFRMLDELAALGSPRPICILTGGDCLSRTDLDDIVSYAALVKVPVAIAPTVSPKLNRPTMRRLFERGVHTASVSLDGVGPTHDALRGVPEHFTETMAAIAMLHEIGFTVHVNTTVSKKNVSELAAVAALLENADVAIWELFFLISTGRGAQDLATTAQQNEEICHFLVDASRYRMTVRTVEAPFFRRVALERLDGGDRLLVSGGDGVYDRLRDQLLESLGPPQRPIPSPRVATRDGKGIVFVAANGDVYPSGFMPLRLGSMRTTPLVDIYRNHSLLHAIRHAEFRGVCGACTYSDLCGGSRARALALDDDPLGDDAGCVLVARSRNGNVEGSSASRAWCATAP
jgi:radical SAM protein